jgi:ABC-type branched-subunit amino acid transport system ATPase component
MTVTDNLTLGAFPRLTGSRLRGDVAGDLERTMLLVEQFAAAALAVADYGHVLENGRISVHGPAAKLRDDPAVRAANLGGGH